VSFPKRELRRAYDRDAVGYDERFAELQRVKYAALLDEVELDPGALVLDLGGGSGLLLAALAERVSLERPPLLLDLSAGMLREARGRRCRRAQADAESLPLRSGCVDIAFAVTSLLGTRSQVLSALLEARRVLRAGGTLAFSLLTSETWEGLSDDLAACGLELRAGPLGCGQDTGYVVGVL